MIRRQYVVSILSIMLTGAIFFLGDCWLYNKAQRSIDQHLLDVQKAARKQHIAFGFSTMQKEGWPWGAARIIILPHLQHEENGTQYTLIATRLHFGGNWLQWLDIWLTQQNLPIHFPQKLLLRTTSQDTAATIEILNSHLTVFPIQKGYRLAFHGHMLSLSSPFMVFPILLRDFNGRIDTNTIGASLTAKLSAAQIALGNTPFTMPSLSRFHLALGLYPRPNAPSERMLFLQDVSLDVPTKEKKLSSETPHIHLSLSGKISFPEKNGLLTLSLHHWRQGVSTFMNMPALRTMIGAGRFLPAGLSPHNQPQYSPHTDTAQTDTPISIDIPVEKGMPVGMSSKTLAMLYMALLPHQTDIPAPD